MSTTDQTTAPEQKKPTRKTQNQRINHKRKPLQQNRRNQRRKHTRNHRFNYKESRRNRAEGTNAENTEEIAVSTTEKAAATEQKKLTQKKRKEPAHQPQRKPPQQRGRKPYHYTRLEVKEAMSSPGNPIVASKSREKFKCLFCFCVARPPRDKTTAAPPTM